MSVTPTSEQTFEGVADLLLMAAKKHPTSGMYIVSGERTRQDAEFLSYAGLLEEAQKIVGGLQAYAVNHGARIALLLDRPRDFFPAFWACLVGGYIPCPIAPVRNDRVRWAMHLAHVHTLLDRPLFICTDSLRHEPPTEIASANIDDLRKKTPCKTIYQPKLSDEAVLVLTSGSTGNSKAAVLTHGNILSSMRGKLERQQLTAADITLNWISFDHVAALFETHMLPLYVGAAQVHVESAAILSEPTLFLRLIDRFRVSMTFSPNFLFGQINAALESVGDEQSRGQRLSLDLSCLRHIISGGEANVVDTCCRFLDLLVPYGFSRNALWPAFGMTETCAGSIYSHEFPGIDLGHEFASVGVPVNGLEMRIVNASSDLLPYGQQGELQLRGPMVFSRYYDNEEETRAAFTMDGWFRTGDLGKIEDGRLRLVGRHKDSIIVSGVNYFSQELETALEQLVGIERSFIAAFPSRKGNVDTEQLVIAFSTTFPPSDEARLYQLIVAIRNTTVMLWGFRPTLVLPLPRSAFPKTSLGKIQRSLMRQRLEAGNFETAVNHIASVMERQLGAYVPPAGPIETKIVETLAKILGISSTGLSATASFFDLGGTSLELLRFTQTLEQQFGLEATVTTVLQFPTARALASRSAAGTGTQSSEYDPMVPLHLTGKKAPLFCIHPGNGGILVYLNLANYFVNERPLYALRPRGFDKHEECFKTFDEMVRTYHDAICNLQPHGPYALAGYSLGGTIAFEIAKLIEARGERVAFLGCIDGFLWDDQPQQASFARLVPLLAWLLQLIDRKEMEKSQEQLQAELQNRDPCEYIFKIASRERLAELNLDLTKFSTWARVAYSVVKLGCSHVTTGTVESMTIFHSDGLSSTPQEWLDRLKGWDKFVRRPRYVKVPGSYFTLMAPAHVAEFQAALHAELDLSMAN